jgi:hypothetical protein
MKTINENFVLVKKKHDFSKVKTLSIW